MACYAPTDVSLTYISTLIKGISIGFETTQNDRDERRFDTTIINGFSVGFELSAADKRYFETTVISGFGVEFEFSPLVVDVVVERRGI